MPFCESCGQQVEEHQKFCPGCGAQIEAPKDNGAQAQPSKKLLDIEVDREDIDQGVEKAKRGLTAAFGFAKRGLSKGAEMAGKGIEAARETLEEKRSSPSKDTQKDSGVQRFCSNCGEAAPGSGKFCIHCGHKLE